MSGPSDRPFPDAVVALRREAATWRCRARAAEARVEELVAQVAGLQAQNASLKARLADSDPRERRWQWKPQRGETG